jgi:hypothetical protein
MTDVMDRSASRPARVRGKRSPSTNGMPHVVQIDRRWVDRVLVALGAVVTMVLLVAGGLLTWGSSFTEDYVTDELSAQNISFPPGEALTAERPDLAGYAGEQVTTGAEAEAYASYIAGHIERIADGATYAELGAVERAASAALAEAQADGAPVDEVAALEEELAQVTSQRDSMFRGEMLRGTLLNTYAWSTIGRIAGYAAIAAFAAAGVMALLVAAGVVHLRRLTR